MVDLTIEEDDICKSVISLISHLIFGIISQTLCDSCKPQEMPVMLRTFFPTLEITYLTYLIKGYIHCCRYEVKFQYADVFT